MFKPKILPLKPDVVSELPCRTKITVRRLYDTVASVRIDYPEGSEPYVEPDGTHTMFISRGAISGLIVLLQRLEQSFKEQKDGEG